MHFATYTLYPDPFHAERHAALHWSPVWKVLMLKIVNVCVFVAHLTLASAVWITSLMCELLTCGERSNSTVSFPCRAAPLQPWPPLWFCSTDLCPGLLPICCHSFSVRPLIQDLGICFISFVLPTAFCIWECYLLARCIILHPCSVF